jgi:tRNA A-37 threonylcarbamoyl transferase component Bud32
MVWMGICCTALIALLVFSIKCREKRYALRCWISQIEEPARRYRLVKNHLEKLSLPYFVGFEYVEAGIFADTGTQPILRMDWIEDESLRDFIEKHLTQPAVIQAAAQSFLTMAQTLHSKQIAHGNLQSENV